jgi:glycosyltransferase involved in cell wall biosynthesis
MVRDQAGLRQRVIMAGHRNDMRRWMGNLDVLVHPATMEGLGVALLQAAAAGVPIIASNVGGIPEVVQDQVNGLLVPPGDVAALRVAVATLLGDPPLRRRLGDAGRLLAPTEFGVARMVDDHIALYREVMAEASSASGARPQASS